jgi:HK97 family phage major capsid protein
MRIAALKQSLAATVASMEGIIEGAIETITAEDGSEASAPRDLTAEEQTQFDALKAKATGLQAQIRREEDMLALKASAASPVNLPGGARAGGGLTVPAQVSETLPPGVMVARIAQAVAIGGGDQRAVAHAAEGLYGSEMGQIVANMEQATNTKGGFLVDEAYSSDFIDILRPRVQVRRMGARSIPMPDGNLTMRKKTAGTSASYIGERAPAPATGATVDQIKMSAKRLTALVPITNQLIRRASLNVQQMIRDDLIEGVAVKEDQQFLRGTGSATAPAGLRNMIASAHVIPANATVNLVNVTNDLGNLRLAVLNANIPMTQCGYIMSPRSMLFLENLRDGNGNKAFPEVAEGRLGIYPIGVTTSVPDNLGGGTNESEIYFGDFAQFMIGDTEQIAIAASDVAAYDDGGTIRAAFSNDETVVRVIAEHDTQVRYDTAFAVLTAVTWAM